MPASSDRAARQPASAAGPADAPDLLTRMRGTPGLALLVAEAVATWRARAAGDGQDSGGAATDADGFEPGWRAFTDAFPTFWEFTNRPR